MSKKEEYLELIRQARIEQKKWINKVRLVVSGLEKDKATVALNPSESPFGEWLYSKAMGYSIANSKLVLTDMETLFDACYQEYHKIYALLFEGTNGNLISSLFGGAKASASDYKIAEQHYEDLLNISDKLLNKLRLFETQLLATGAEKFDKVLSNEEVIVQEEVKTPKQKEQRYYRGSLIEE